MRIYLGDIEAKQFVAAINCEKFDYTEWQRDFFDSMTAEDFNSDAVNYELENPFPNAVRL